MSTVRAASTCVRITLVVLAVHVWSPDSLGQDTRQDNDRASARLNRFKVVGDSLKMVEAGTDRSEVLGQLISVGTKEPADAYIGAAALRAIFHIAGQDQRIQECLLRVIRNPRTNDSTRRGACRLIVYVADERGRKELLADVKRRWHEQRKAPGLEALVELGDEEALRWLKEIGRSEDLDECARRYVDSFIERLEVQQNTSDLLEYIQSDRDGIDRGWAVRQAKRHGATCVEIRDAVMSHLRRVAPRTSALSHASLVIACDECAVFTADDANEIEAIQTVRHYLNLLSQEGAFPAWATLPEVRRAQFYRFER